MQTVSGPNPEKVRVPELRWKKTEPKKNAHFSTFFSKIDGNEGGRPKLGGPISAWGGVSGKLMDPFPEPDHHAMLRFWKMRGVGVIGL